MNSFSSPLDLFQLEATTTLTWGDSDGHMSGRAASAKGAGVPGGRLGAVAAGNIHVYPGSDRHSQNNRLMTR